MNYIFNKMTQNQAKDIASNWHYEGKYSFYDATADEEDLAELLSPQLRGDKYYIVTNDDVEMGFFCFEGENDSIEIGLGMKPEWTGKGLGLDFVKAGLRYAISNLNPREITLSVTTFNERAIKVYKKAGFESVETFKQDTNGSRYEFLKMKMEVKQTYIKRIREVYPELEVHSAKFNHTGQNNDVLIVNNELVFRFAKYQEGVEQQLKKETSILNEVSQYVSLPIPTPMYQHFETNEPEKTFVGYRMIQGEPLWKKALNCSNQIPGLAKQLATFLKELHAVPIQEMSLNLTYSDPYKELVDLYASFKEKLFPFMRQDAQQDISNRFETYFGDTKHFDFEPCLIHGDFGPSNILYNAADDKVTGIIDFGGSCMGDPAYDFAGILSGYGERFLNMLIGYDPDKEQVLERVRFYKSTFALQEALFGVNNNDQEAFQNGIKDYV